MQEFDVIVVGARCAGSPTAMLLARKGYKVLLVDRATFPSDTISTHLIHPPGVASLRKWGLLNRLVATGCPAIDVYAFDMGPFVISGSPGTEDNPVSYGPRRTVLDKLLVDAAAEAGVNVRTGFTVDEILLDDGRVMGIRGHSKGGQPVAERARVVVGADGFHSLVARAVGAEQYNEKRQLEAGYYSYWSGLPMNNRFEAYDRGDRMWAAWPTNDDLTLVIVSWPYAEFEANKSDVEGHYLKAFDKAPKFQQRMQAARREERFVGMAVPNFFRKPFGPGWALVGDAGYHKDPAAAQGITDAFRDAELLSDALDRAFTDSRPVDEALADYARSRDAAAMPWFRWALRFARFDALTPPMRDFLLAIAADQEWANRYCGLNAETVNPDEFFAS